MEEYAIVTDIVTEIVEEAPPCLLDLTSLQILANRRFGLTAAETLECAQKLYEAEVLTYPRTSSHYITSDMAQTVSALLSRTESNDAGNGNFSASKVTTAGNTLFMETERNFFGNTVNYDVKEVEKKANEDSTSVKLENTDGAIIHNAEHVIGESEIIGGQIEANEYFRGDQFSEKDSYESSVDELRKSEFINANASTTCDLNANLDGALDSNETSSSRMSDEQKAFVKELMEMRETVPIITEDTVMQKVISEEQFREYIRAEDPKVQVSGCASKAADVVPYINNIKQAYEILRLDYNGTPYKELVEKKGDMYVMRFTSDYCPANSAYPKMDGTEPWNKPPCTGTGYTGSKEHLVPEYTYGRGQEISDGVIYKVDYEGKETLVAIWNHGRFEKVE